VNGALADGQGTGTILNADASGFAISDVNIAEPRSGTASAVFTVTQSPPLGGAATVGFQTVAGSAVAPADFTATAGTLTFTAGQTSQTVAVSVKADTVAEVTETFHVDLSGSSGPAIARPRGTATVHDPGFYSVTPCRVLDTRVSTAGPALSAGVTRSVVVGGVCGVPKAASAVSLNVTVGPATCASSRLGWESLWSRPSTTASAKPVRTTRPWP
jgi:hypothetical protein